MIDRELLIKALALDKDASNDEINARVKALIEEMNTKAGSSVEELISTFSNYPAALRDTIRTMAASAPAVSDIDRAVMTKLGLTPAKWRRYAEA